MHVSVNFKVYELETVDTVEIILTVYTPGYSLAHDIEIANVNTEESNTTQSGWPLVL